MVLKFARKLRKYSGGGYASIPALHRILDPHHLKEEKCLQFHHKLSNKQVWCMCGLEALKANGETEHPWAAVPAQCFS